MHDRIYIVTVQNSNKQLIDNIKPSKNSATYIKHHSAHIPAAHKVLHVLVFTDLSSFENIPSYLHQ